MLSPGLGSLIRHLKQLVYTKSWCNNRKSINHIIAINIRYHFTIPMNCHRNISFKCIFSIFSRFLSKLHPLLTICLLSTTAIWPTDLTLSASRLVASLSLVFVWSNAAAKPTVIICTGFSEEQFFCRFLEEGIHHCDQKKKMMHLNYQSTQRLQQQTVVFF